jgi:hypothetical protein
MKKLLKNVWRKVREWFKGTCVDLDGLEGLGLPSDSSSPAEAGAVPGRGSCLVSSGKTSAGEEGFVGSPDRPIVESSDGGRIDGGRQDDKTGDGLTGDDVGFTALEWRYGGFKGGKATLSDRARIRGLKVTRNGLSYSWESGGCEDLGAPGPRDATCLACLFCHVRDQWLGGKFDWISTDRRTRDLENIESGYGGWEYEAFRDADAYAFVVVSKDGKRRTNVIVQKGRN